MMHAAFAVLALLAQDPTSEKESAWGWVDFGDEGFSGVRARASLVFWPNFEGGERFFVETPAGLVARPDRYSADLWAAAVGVSFEKFEFEVEYIGGTGEGDGRGELSGSPGELDYDVEVRGARLSVARPVWGYDGDRFDFFLGAGLAALYLREKFDGFEFTPDDGTPASGLAGSQERIDWRFGPFVWAGAALKFGDEAPAAFLRAEVGDYFGDAGGVEMRISLGIDYRF